MNIHSRHEREAIQECSILLCVVLYNQNAASCVCRSYRNSQPNHLRIYLPWISYRVLPCSLNTKILHFLVPTHC